MPEQRKPSAPPPHLSCQQQHHHKHQQRQQQRQTLPAPLGSGPYAKKKINFPARIENSSLNVIEQLDANSTVQPNSRRVSVD
ncbi:hypothetical protein M0804_002343 [Polistes exclamans]|nr:hypothetical protein M0804_002343 [Polistes exclamans]